MESKKNIVSLPPLKKKDRSELSRRFEKLAFCGVPEHPEPTYQRNDHSIYSIRNTGESTTSVTSSEIIAHSRQIGKVVENKEKQEFCYTRTTSPRDIIAKNKKK